MQKINNGHDTTVYHQWATRPADERFDSMEALEAHLRGKRERSRGAKGNIGRLHAVAHHGAVALECAAFNRPIVPSNWMFGQVAAAVSAPASYLRTLPAPLAADCVNYSLSRSDNNKDVKLLMEDTGDLLIGRAATGPEYGRIWNTDVLDMVNRFNDMSGGAFYAPWDWTKKFRSLFAGDRDMFVFMIDGGSIVDGGGERDQLHRGFYTWNSEVGRSTWGISMFLFQECCGNFQIWGQTQKVEIKMRHTKNAPIKFGEIYENLQQYLTGSTVDEVAMIKRAKQFELPADDNARFNWVLDQGLFTKTEAKGGIEIALETIGDCKNLWQLVDGMTMLSRSYKYMDERLDLDKRAGKLMDLVIA